MTVICFFNLRLGWVLSGLVVPGYLVPLLLIKPWAASVVLGESFLTYFLVWFFSEFLSRWGPWNNFFGRDRFFAIVLCSIVVRLSFDSWLLPELGAWVTQRWHIAFDYRNQLHSIGLIIIALIANQFWKTGFVRGLIPLTICLTLTLLIVRYGLMVLTNFSLSSIGYLYEDMASSILATPKAYIIMLITALLASRLNLRYGWDFNGILIPSLLALQWYQPVKIAATVIEALLILLLSTAVLKLPLFSGMTMEGARKLLLFFNVGFAYKLALGFVLMVWFPEVKVTDYYAFGYLLSTLVAIKIHDKGILARLTRATLQTSLLAVGFSSVIGFALTLLPDPVSVTATQAGTAGSRPVVRVLEQELSALLQQEQVQLYQTKAGGAGFVPPLPGESESFKTALTFVRSYIEHHNRADLEHAAASLAAVHYRLDVVKDRYLYIHETVPGQGWGIYLFDTHNTSKLALEVPAPLNESGVFEAGAALFEVLQAQSLAIAGSDRKAAADLSADVLHNRQTFFNVFHRLFSRHDCLQIRGYDAEMTRALAGVRRTEGDLLTPAIASALWVKERLPPSLDLVKLKRLLQTFSINWEPPPFANQQREMSVYGFAELLLNEQDLRKLLFRPLLLQQDVKLLEQDLNISGYLKSWLLSGKAQIAEKGSGLYVPPKLQELIYLDELVLTPMLRVADRYALRKRWNDADSNELRVIAHAAQTLGYRLVRYRHRLSQQEYLILTERDERQRRYWGTYVVRLGATSNYVVQIPRPLFEVNTFEYGVDLFESLQAKALMISTSHPQTNSDNSADVIAPDNKLNVFNLFNQVLFRETPETEMLALHTRAFGYRTDQPLPETDIMFAVDSGVQARAQLNTLAQQLWQRLENANFKVKLVDGSAETEGYEVGQFTQTQYLSATAKKHLAILWLSPELRSGFRQQSQNVWQAAQFDALTIETVQQGLFEYMQRQGVDWTETRPSAQFDAPLRGYVQSQDIIDLQTLASALKQQGYRLQRLIDASSQQAFLVLLNKRDKIVAVANLRPNSAATTVLPSANALDQRLVTTFIDQRSAWLEAGGD